MMRGANDNKRKELRSIPTRRAVRLIAFLLSAVLLPGGAALPQKAEAAYGDLDSGLDDNTYALQVSTGTVSVTGSLADEILYFKINYEDEDGYVRSHRIFPGENALKDSMDWAEQQGTTGSDTAVRTMKLRQSIMEELGVSVTREESAFQPYATDTFFFQPLKKVKSIQSIEILMCDQVTGNGNQTNGTWACQAMRVYQVSAVRGMEMYGYVSGRMYADFDGTLIAKMEQSKTFNWTSDRMFRITSDGSGNAMLTQTSESYTTQTAERILRMDIADTYGAGIRALGNYTKKTLTGSNFGECAALALRYQDIYGATREAYLPLATSVIGYALEKGVSANEYLSGIAQDGETLALAATLPDLAAFVSVRLIYGTDAAVAATGIKLSTAQSDASSGGEDRVVKPADTAGEDVDLLSIAGFSVYDPASSNVSLAVQDTMLRATFSGTPVSYYRAPSTSGTTVRPIKAGGSGVEIALQEYESGARLLPKDSTERYLVILNTDDAELAGTSSDLIMTLSYTDLNGQTQSSGAINVSDAVDAYYGEWPGVRSGFMYRAGAKGGGSMYFTVSLKDVDQFTGAQFLLRGSDDWQMKNMEIYRLDELGTLSGTWETISDGAQTSDRSYFRTYTGTRLLVLDRQILVDGGGDASDTEFNSDSTTKEDTDTGDWSAYRYSMSYETTQTLGRFAKSRCNYTVAVEVGDDQVTDTTDGDCGSKNQFYFQLIFEDGKSGYVLANQQLAADGFRTGYTEQFTISTNRDMGELTAIKILPEDSTDRSDVFDKLKIESICVKKQTNEAVSRQWGVNNVGWIDINYQDEAANSSSMGYHGRSESELVKNYQIEASTYAVNLEFAITTGTYSVSANTDMVEPQFTGQVYGVVEYYDSNGARKTATYNLVEAMYTYAGQERKTGKKETIGQNTWPGGTESDPNLMFRAGKTDRFTIGIEDISQLLRVTLEVRSKVATTWNIESMYVSLVGNDGKRIINTENEYQWTYSEEMQRLCSSTNSGEKAYSLTLPINQVQAVDIDFTENKIEWSDAAKGQIASVTSRLPRSADDSLNIYVYTADTDDAAALRGVTMQAGAQYSRVYGGFNRVEKTLTYGESSGRSVFYATDVSASGINTLNKLELLAYFNDLNASGEVPLDHAVVQQVRSGVVINTFYIDFSGCDAAADSKGVSRAPEAKPEKAQFSQVVTLAFEDATSSLRLTPETDDVAVALRYTTTNDVSGREYESSFIYLTDQGWSELRAGKVVELTFNEPYVKEITAIRLRGTGHGTRSGVGVASATAMVYEADSVSGEDYCTGSFSFAEGVTLTTGQGDRLMPCTGSASSETGGVGELTLSFTVPEVKDVPAVAENANGPVGMRLNYRTVDGVLRELSVYDIREYAEGSGASFQSGSTVTLRLLIPEVEEIRYLSLSPTNEAGNAATLTLSDMSATLRLGEKEIGYQRSLQDWRGSGVIPLYNSVQVKLSAVTTRPSSNTQEQIEVESGTRRQLVESGQEVVITPTVTGSDEGYTYRVEKFKDSFTSNAPEVLTSGNGTLRFCAVNEYSSGVGTETYYRVTVSSREVSSVETVMEFVVEPKYIAPAAENASGSLDGGTTNAESASESGGSSGESAA